MQFHFLATVALITLVVAASPIAQHGTPEVPTRLEEFADVLQEVAETIKTSVKRIITLTP
ncbi:hypothetical protein JNB11_08875 [Kocuria palustris]|nr:hypothetical protein [Kocuria palustris]